MREIRHTHTQNETQTKINVYTFIQRDLHRQPQEDIQRRRYKDKPTNTDIHTPFLSVWVLEIEWESYQSWSQVSLFIFSNAMPFMSIIDNALRRYVKEKQ